MNMISSSHVTSRPCSIILYQILLTEQYAQHKQKKVQEQRTFHIPGHLAVKIRIMYNEV